MIEKILKDERGKSNLSPDSLGSFLYGKKFYQDLKSYLEKGPVLSINPNIFNESRLEIIKDAYNYLPMTYNFNRNQ